MLGCAERRGGSVAKPQRRASKSRHMRAQHRAKHVAQKECKERSSERRARRQQHQKHGPKPWWVRNRHSQQCARGQKGVQRNMVRRWTHLLHARRRRKPADGAGQPRPSTGWQQHYTQRPHAARSACESAATSLERWPRRGCGRKCAQWRHSVMTWAEALLHKHGPKASMPPSRGRAAEPPASSSCVTTLLREVAPARRRRATKLTRCT